HPADGAAANEARPVAVVADDALAAAGEDPAVALDRIGHGASFAYGQRLRFFTVDVLARLAGLHGDDGVPVVRSGDEARVDVVAGQHLAKVAVDLGILVAVTLVDRIPGAIALLLADVAGGDHLHLLKAHQGAHVARALATGADRGHHDTVIGGPAAQ